MDSGRIPNPHAVCVALPIQSHTKCMLILAKLLHSRGIQITFVITEYNHKLFLQSGGAESLAGLPDFKFITIPDGLPLSDSNVRNDPSVLIQSIRNNSLCPLVELIEKNTPVSCIISDAFMTFTIDAGEKLGIPVVLLWTVAACSLFGYQRLPDVLEKGFVPLKGTNTEYLDTIIEWVPNKNGIRVKDLPSINRVSDTEEKIFNICVEAALRCYKASANIINTFDELEADILSLLASSTPQLYTIGPLHLLLDQVPEKELLNSINGCSLWKEEHLCIQWLDSKEPNSVLYVNFGSLVTLPSDKFVELAVGLANSNQNFLWIMKPDFVMDDSAILPSGFLEETKERGFVTSWCPQEQVLNHPSVGVFLTHSGWNSTLESLSAGVPMICFPIFFEQPMNCKYTCTEWGIGVELNSDFNRHDVETMVKEMMEGEDSKKIKGKALEWKEKAFKATGTNGSSWLNLDKLIKKFFT